MRRTLALVFVAMGALSSACGQETPPATSQEPGPAQDANSPGGSSVAASCVETYSLETLAERDYAFDGTIESIEPGPDGSDAAVFDVEEWFKGGEGATATRRGSFSSLTSAGGEDRNVGDRLLVAGDDDFAWDCGFTQPYDAEVAADWSGILEG